jgi:hypothetical protein
LLEHDREIDNTRSALQERDGNIVNLLVVGVHGAWLKTLNTVLHHETILITFVIVSVSTSLDISLAC